MDAIHICVGQFGNRMGTMLAARLKAENFGSSAILVDSEPKVVAEAAKICGESCTYIGYQSGRGNNFAMGYVLPRTHRNATRHFLSATVPIVQLEAFVDEVRCGQAKSQISSDRFAEGNSPSAGDAQPSFPADENAQMLHKTADAVRKQLEKRSNCSVLMFYLATAGGTGSGFGARLWTHFADEYPDLGLLGTLLLPASFGENSLQSLNVVLSLSHAANNLEGFLYFKNDDLLREVGAVTAGGGRARNTTFDFAALDGLIADRLSCLYMCIDAFDDLSIRSCFNETTFGPCNALRLCAQQVHKQRYEEFLREALRKTPLSASVLLCETSREEMTVAELIDFRRIACTAGALSHVGRAKSGQATPLLSILVNDAGTVEAFSESASRSRVLVSRGAYLHHFERFGLDRFELLEAIEGVEQLNDSYRAFTA